MSAKPRVNLILDCLILLAFLMTIVSGLDLEDTLRLSFETGGVPFAMHRHSMAAFLFIGLVLTHQLFHWKWIMSQLRLLFKGSRRAQAQEG